MEKDDIGFRIGTHVLAGVVGGALVAGAGLASGWLVTESTMQKRIVEQRVADLADVCEVLGERQWRKRNADMQGLRGWAYDKNRERLATEVLQQMHVDRALIRSVTQACADRFYA